MHQLHSSTPLNHRCVFLPVFNTYVSRVGLQLQKLSTLSSCQTGVGPFDARAYCSRLTFHTDIIIVNNIHGNQFNDNRSQTTNNCTMDEKAVEKVVEKAVVKAIEKVVGKVVERALMRALTLFMIACVIVMALILFWLAHSCVQIHTVLCLFDLSIFTRVNDYY